MLDLPIDTFEKPKTEIEQIVTVNSKTRDIFSPSVRQKGTETTDPLYLQAKTIVDSMNTSFSWGELTNIIKESFRCVQLNQKLTIEEQKQHVIKILNYIIDLTDTPYVPDEWTDPAMKAILPSIIDMVSKALNGRLIPILSDAPPSPETFRAYINKTKDAFSDGFQWSDLGICIENAILFVSGFASLTKAQMQESVIDIVNTIIDCTDTPFIPDSMTDPILKAIVPPLVSFIFEKL